MKILITGAYGFVGTNLCRHLSGKGHVCDALDIPAARREGVPYARVYTWEDLETDGAAATSAPDLTSYDAVVHLAGKAHDLKKVASEQSYFDINVGLTERIVRKLIACGAGKSDKKINFIYFSSSKADEKGNAYGRSKWAAERYLLGLAAPDLLNIAILRPAMIHGPGNKGNLNLLWKISRLGLPWPLAAFENKRSFTAIGNVCAAVEVLCACGANGVYPIADDTMLSTNRLIELIAEVRGRKAKLWRLPKGLMRFAARVGDVCHLPLNTERLAKLTEDSFVDNSELKRILGWEKMPVEAEDGMRMTLELFD